eukprot:57473-Prymnesium_polylepis.1
MAPSSQLLEAGEEGATEDGADCSRFDRGATASIHATQTPSTMVQPMIERLAACSCEGGEAAVAPF